MVVLKGLRGHVLRGAHVIEHLRFIGHFFHLAIPEINDGYFFADFWIAFEEDVVGFEVPMHDLFILDVDVCIE